MKKSYIFTLILSIILVGVAFFFHEKLSEFRSLGLVGIFLINLIGSATLFLPAPGIASVVAGGSIYPPLLVALVASLGASVGDMVGYLLGTSSKHILLENKDGHLKTLMFYFKKYGAPVIVLLAFFPNPFFDAIGIVAGVLGYPVKKFFLWMFVGRLLRNILLAYVGNRFF